MARPIFWFLLGIVMLPLGVIALSFTSFDIAVWQHLYQTVLTDYVTNSLLLAVGVGLGVCTLGASVAWYISRYDFLGRELLGWLSVLPLAMPAYIIAYTYTGLLDYSGPIQTQLREWFGWGYGDYWFPEIKSLGGATTMLVLVLYPYVYLLARNAFTAIPQNLEHAATSLGVSQRGYFWRIALPIARPAIVAGGMLAMMEALADYGTVAFFGVSTFTTGIFRTWYGMGSQISALQLSGLLVLFVFICLFWEQKSRRQVQTQTQTHRSQRVALTGASQIICLVCCGLPVLLGFLIPFVQLTLWVTDRLSDWSWQDYWPLVSQTLLIAFCGAVLTLLVAVFMSYARRFQPDRIPSWSLNLASLGYALPGVVVAVGLLVPFGWSDRQLNYFTQAWFDSKPGLILSGTLVVVLVAYAIRFLAVALQHSQNGLARITPSMEQAAYSLGHTPSQTLYKVHLPLMRNSILAAVLLVFVDIMKELPATLVLRPFNFNTLAVKAYEYAMEERLQQAALPSLTIVLCGLIPVFLLIRQLRKNEDLYADH